MGFDSKGLDDYIDVAQRIAEFRAKHPEGSLQPVNPQQPFEIRELTGTDKSGKEQRGTFIIYTAAAYRSPDDQRPGIGCAYEVFPGRTPYTAGSELQNAETAAWGRAIVAALGADAKAGIASQQEVRNRRAERDGDGQAQQNGTPRGQVVRPVARPVAEAGTEVDTEAQDIANEAHGCRSLNELKTRIYVDATRRQKLTCYIADPGTGTKGKLGQYLNFRRQAIEDLDKAWQEFNDAAGRKRTDLAEMEIQFRQHSGIDPEAATPAQIREFIASLDKAAA